MPRGRRTAHHSVARFGGVGRLVTPNEISNLKGWYRADTIAGVADGGSIAQWNDSSGNAAHLAQATGSKQPTYKLNIQNGQPVVRFASASAQIMATSAYGAALSQANTIALVYKVNNFATLRYLFDGNGSARHVCYHTQTTGLRHMFGGIDIEGAAAGTSWNVALFDFNAPASNLYVNGVRDLADVNTGAVLTLGGFTIGGTAADDAGVYHDGDVGEILIYNALLTAAQRYNVTRYLGQKYGIAVA